MTKRLNSKHKVDRRLRVNLWGRPKSPFNTRAYAPGQHGQTRSSKPSDYGIQLQAKQKLKSSQFNQTGSLLAMINGIDSDKYASIDTNEKESGDEEEISLNTKKIKYADYMARIKHQIEKVWTYPEQAARNGISGQITLRFKLSRDGNLLSIRMLESSGEKILDMAAIKAVKGAAPYYPFPKTLTTKRLVITASFLYSPSYSKPYAYR